MVAFLASGTLRATSTCTVVVYASAKQQQFSVLAIISICGVDFSGLTYWRLDKDVIDILASSSVRARIALSTRCCTYCWSSRLDGFKQRRRQALSSLITRAYYLFMYITPLYTINLFFRSEQSVFCFLATL